MNTQSVIPVLLIVIVVTVAVLGLAGFIVFDSSVTGSSVTDDSSGTRVSDASVPLPDVSGSEANRIQQVAKTQVPVEPPYVETERGVVKESTDRVIRLQGLVSERVFPVAEDAEVWNQGEKIRASDIEPGETVSLRVQELGNREDGWIRTVIRINVDPGAGVSSPADRADGLVTN